MRARRLLVLATTSALAVAGASVTATGAGARPVTAAPAAVRSVRVGTVTAASVALSWTNPARATATVVRVARGTTAPRSRTSGTAVATVKKPGHAATAARLAPETAYTFALFSTSGHNRYSRAAVVHTVTAPAAVTRVHAASTETSVTLGWTNPPAGSIGTLVVRYAKGATAPRTPTTGTAAPLASARAPGVTVNGLAAGTTYTFGIWVRDPHGRYSAAVATRVATVALPGAVTNAYYTVSAPVILLHWTNPTSPAFTGVRICGVPGVPGGAAEPDPRTCANPVDLGKDTLYGDPGLAPNTTYVYWLFAHDAAGYYAPGTSITVLSPPPAPAGVKALVYSSTAAIITWTAPTDVFICRVAGGAPAPDPDACGLFVGTKKQYVDRTALPGRTYDYYVYTGGPGGYSVPAEQSLTMRTPTGATVEGTVTAADSPKGVGGVTVYLIAPNGRPVRDTDDDGVPDSDVLAATTTAPDGSYAITAGTLSTDGIPPSNVGAYVCFDAQGTGNHASQCHAGATWDTDPERPVGTTVPLVAGVIDTVDASLAGGGGLAGTLTSAGKGAAGAEVDVLSATTHQLASTITAADGGWVITGLNPGSYHVCFYGDSSKTARTGYGPQCYHGTVTGTAAQAATVTVAAGKTTYGINDSVVAGGSLTGVVQDAAGNALQDVDVYIFDSGRLVGYDYTSGPGAYTIAGLPTGQSLTVCVDGEYATINGGAGTGYDAECGGGAAWDVQDAPSAGATVTLTPGQLQFDDFSLTSAGAVTGQVTDANTRNLGNVAVRVFGAGHDAQGNPLEWDGLTDSAGNYSVGGLPAGSYRVCFDATGTGGTIGPAPDPGWVSRCTGTATWDGTTPAGSSVLVVAGSSTVDSPVLARAGAFGGTARNGVGAPLTDVTVAAVTPDGEIAATYRSATDGTYALTDLPAGTYHLCWSGARSVDPTAPAGYTSGCVGSSGAWTGGAAAPYATAFTVSSGSFVPQDLTLTAATGGSLRAARTASAATSSSAGSDRGMTPGGLSLRATRRLTPRVARLVGR